MNQTRKNKLSEVISGCLKEDRKEQNALYALFYSYGMSIAIRYVTNENDAISILNDSFMKVFKNIHSYDRSNPFKPWFRRILINTCLNELKRSQNVKFVMEVEYLNIPNTEESILAEMEYKELLQIIQTLPKAYKTVFNLYVIDGFKHKEIAQMLGISAGTSKSNLMRARLKLAQLINTTKFNTYVSK